jgi:CheY-like chemotaxis protein/HPt (histidine-containing phosphotransfer) domain-containing protein
MGRLILLAEDNETNREVIQEQLRRVGYASEAASDGSAALDMWRSGRYALVLTDYHMPNMDGYQLAAAIREEEPEGKHFPIIAVTANAMHGEADRCLEKGMDDYLSKPLRLDKLGAMLSKWLPLKKKHEEMVADMDGEIYRRSHIQDSPLIWDATMLSHLVGDNPSMHRRLLDKFMFNSEKQVAELINAVAAGQAIVIMEVAHKLKSAARTVGAMQFGELCHDLENAGREGDIQAIHVLAQGLDAAYRDVADLIKRAAQ